MGFDKLNGKKIKCKCKVGYRGKYCDIWYCNKNCNNNGICKGPSTCHCYPLYKGKKCDTYFINKYLSPVKDNTYMVENQGKLNILFKILLGFATALIISLFLAIIIIDFYKN
ncbi:hypothetical protein HZS_3124 [Henneguya salminicola]|nr:hypothetical protein HZS_3124 [Henneguya salminicola]